MFNKTPMFLIWGCNPFSAYINNICNKNKINIKGFISPNGERTFEKKSVYEPKTISNDAKLNTLPIIIACDHAIAKTGPLTTLETIYQFKKTLQEILEVYQFNNHLLHPCVLADIIRPTLENKIIPFGLPGSGIVLFGRICDAIVNSYPNEFLSSSEEQNLIRSMIFEYHFIVNNAMQDLLSSKNFRNLHSSAYYFSKTFHIANYNDSQLAITSFTTRNYHNTPSFNYHCIPSNKEFKTLKKQKINFFYCIRNPLDNIVSALNKIGELDKENKFASQKALLYLTVYFLKNLIYWHKFSKKVPMVKYEDLTDNPINSIVSLIGLLNVKTGDHTRTAKKIWDDLSFRQLDNAPNQHFWSGGSGKWKTYLSRENLSLLKHLKMEKVLKLYSYNEVLAEFNELTNNISSTEWQKSAPAELIQQSKNMPTFYNHILFNEDKETEGLTFTKKHSKKIGDFHLLSEDENLINIAKPLFENKYINKLKKAGELS